MKDVWDACIAAGIPIPTPVERFFDDGPPDPAGITMNLTDAACCREWKSDYCSGFEVDLAALPPNITHLRFQNCW